MDGIYRLYFTVWLADKSLQFFQLPDGSGLMINLISLPVNHSSLMVHGGKIFIQTIFQTVS